jgi:hypothetical protein
LPQINFIGEPVKTTRVYLLLFALSLCLSSSGLAGQSNAPHDYSHQRKSAEKYQKHQIKEQQKQQKAKVKAQEKEAKAYRKQHQ